MDDYIRRKAAEERLNRLERESYHNSVLWPDHVEECREAIRDIPPDEVRPVVRGEWRDDLVAFYRGCPVCGAYVRANLDEVFLKDFPSSVGELNFCPNCGADMRGEQHG